MFSPEFRESSSKIIFSMLSSLVEDRQDVLVLDMEETSNNKEKLTNLMMDTMLKNTEVAMTDTVEYLRVKRICEMLLQANKEMKVDPPKFHITKTASLQAYSLGRHVVLSQGSLDIGGGLKGRVYGL